MAQTKAGIGLLQAMRRGSARTFVALPTAILGNARTVIIVSLVLISGSFASAALIQMKLDREHALGQAAIFEARRASELAATLSMSLDRYTAIARGFASDTLDAESAAALAEAGGAAMKNVAVLDASGRLLSEMKAAPRSLLPLSRSILGALRTEPFVGPSADGQSLMLILPAAGHRVLAIQLDPRLLIPQSPDALLAMTSGRLLMLGSNWSEMPGVAGVELEDDISATRILEFPRSAKLVSLSKVRAWPLVAGTSVDVGKALQSWYGSLPLYIFFIIGPAFAGAGLAAVFVREFERRMRAAQAARALRSKKPDEARLLVRLADAERRAIRAERAKAEFMSHMSHELRTPLNAIIGFSEIIEEGTLGPIANKKYVEYARDIRLAGHQLHARLSDILEFADIDARRRTLAVDIVNVSALARECLQVVLDKARARSVRLLASLPPDLCAVGDAAAVSRILSGLLANAVEFSPNGGEVRVTVKREGDWIVAAVRDLGLGFSEEERARAGEAFRRFDRPGHSTGLGLGLSIATTLARRMAGSLRIDARQGEGCTIEVRLPVDKSSQARTADVRGEMPTNTSRTPPR